MYSTLSDSTTNRTDFSCTSRFVYVTLPQPSTNALNPEAVFALKLMGTYVKTTTSSSSSSISSSSSSSSSNRLPNGGSNNHNKQSIIIINTVKTELLDMVRNNHTTAVHLQRLCTCYFGESAKSSPDFPITGGVKLSEISPLI